MRSRRDGRGRVRAADARDDGAQPRRRPQRREGRAQGDRGTGHLVTLRGVWVLGHAVGSIVRLLGIGTSGPHGKACGHQDGLVGTTPSAQS